MARGGKRWDDECCAEHDGTIASFRKLSMKIEAPEKYGEMFKRECVNVVKAGKMAALAVGGAVVLGPAALRAAPAIGGMLGSSFLVSAGGSALSGAAATNAGLAWFGGGALAAGGMGIAGGVTVLTAAGGALGATLGGVISNSYFRQIEDFEIRKVRSGRGPAVVFINGFLSQRTEGFEEWEEGLDKHFPRNPWYQVRWESKRLADIGTLFASTATKELLIRSLKKAANVASRKAANKILPGALITHLFYLAKNPWHTAMVRAAQTGALLADILALVPRKRFILLGNSLGARVVFYTLCALGTKGQRCIESVHLLGGAVGRDDVAAWRIAARAVRNGIYNYHSDNDYVLRYLYRIGTLFQSEPIGCSPLDVGVPCVTNIDVSKHVKGHKDYKAKLATILYGKNV